MGRVGVRSMAALAALAAVFTVAACGRAPAPADARACVPPARPADAEQGGELVLGRVLFLTPVGARPGQALQRGSAADGRSFSKFGVYVFGEGPVSIEPLGPVDVVGWAQGGVTPAIRDQATFGTSPSSSCDEQRWRVYPGGLVYARPQCATVRVRADGRTAHVRFGLAVDCPVSPVNVPAAPGGQGVLTVSPVGLSHVTLSEGAVLDVEAS